MKLLKIISRAPIYPDDDDDDDDICSDSSNYLQDFNQIKVFRMIIIIKRELELQE